MAVFLAPDVYVNASVAGAGLAPEQVVNRVLGNKETRAKSSAWVLDRVEAMLSAHPNFKKESVATQMSTIRALVDVVDVSTDHAAEAWLDALVDAAKAAKLTRVVTDHPDLADQEPHDGIEFMSTDAWMIEQTTPPPFSAA